MDKIHRRQPPRLCAKRAMAISRLEKMAKISTARVASVKAERTRVHEHFDRCSKENRAEEDEN
jgi:hypothetical protein